MLSGAMVARSAPWRSNATVDRVPTMTWALPADKPQRREAISSLGRAPPGGGVPPHRLECVCNGADYRFAVCAVGQCKQRRIGRNARGGYCHVKCGLATLDG